MAISVGYDSYADVAFADEYFGARLYADKWFDLAEEVKEKALKQATRHIDRLPFRGVKANKSQPLQFPRCYPAPLVFDTSLVPPPVLSEYTYDMTIMTGWYCEIDIPLLVKYATCEEAYALIEAANNLRTKLQQEGVQRISIGSLTEVYEKTNMFGLTSKSAFEYLKPFLAKVVRIV